MHQKASLFRIYCMTYNFEKHEKSDNYAVPEGLFDKVMFRIKIEQRLAIVRRRVIFVVVAFITGLISFIPVWGTFSRAYAQSGFGQYLQLLFSDFSSVIAHWQDYSLGLLESFPVISTVELLSVIFIVLLTLRFVFKYSKELLSLSPLIRINVPKA
jgi:hypothetical protein